MANLVAGLAIVSFAISWLATLAMKRLAPRLGFVDSPGHRKIHHVPKPLGGGVAIFLGVALPLLGVIAIGWFRDFDPASNLIAYAGGIRRQTPLALWLLGAMLAMHLMGLLDDRKTLGPYVKLIIQLAVTTALVAQFKPLWALTTLDDAIGAGGALSVTVSVLWIVTITNAFNFLDNMDGLSAGVAAVCTTAFLIAALSVEQWFVAGMLGMLLGALVGFLCFNFHPATIFMGDSGSLVIGLLLGVLTLRAIYLPEGMNLSSGWYSVLAPVIVLAVPLYDLLVVSAIRISHGRSPFVGDANHLSHRLVARGMSRRTAVLCIWLMTACTAIAAILLTQVQSQFGAGLILGQTLLVLGLVGLLEQHRVEEGTQARGGKGSDGGG